MPDRDALLRRVRTMRSQSPPMTWDSIWSVLVSEAAGDAQSAIEAVQEEEHRAAQPHARSQPAGAGGLKTAPILAA